MLDQVGHCLIKLTTAILLRIKIEFDENSIGGQSEISFSLLSVHMDLQIVLSIESFQ
jgi:hypothetical protein